MPPYDSGASQANPTAKPMTQEEYQAAVIQAIKDLIPKPASSEGEPTTAADSTAETTTEPDAPSRPHVAETSEARPLAPPEDEKAATAAATSTVVETPKPEHGGTRPGQDRTAERPCPRQADSGRIEAS